MTPDRQDWLHDFNTRFGVPDARRRTVGRALLAWWQSEGGATDADLIVGLSKGQETDFNPFNTTLVVPGHSHPQPGNSVPVAVYDSYEVGMNATLATLRESRYDAIRHAIMTKGVHAKTICKRIVESDWGTTEQPMYAVLGDIQRGLWHEYADIKVYPPG